MARLDNLTLYKRSVNCRVRTVRVEEKPRRWSSTRKFLGCQFFDNVEEISSTISRKCFSQFLDNVEEIISLKPISLSLLQSSSRNGLSKHIDTSLVWPFLAGYYLDIMKKFGCPDKFISIVKSLHTGMQARVLDQGSFSDMFDVTNGVKQGCVLAPTLFSIMFAAMLKDAFKHDPSAGIYIRSRTEGGIFSLRRLQAKSKVMGHVVSHPRAAVRR